MRIFFKEHQAIIAKRNVHKKNSYPLVTKTFSDIMSSQKLYYHGCLKYKQWKSLVYLYCFSSVQSLSHVRLFATPWIAARQASLSITNSWSLLKFMSIESVIQPSHPAISSSVVPFSSCPQSFPESGSFPMSQLFTSGGQRIGVSALTSILPLNIQDYLL